MSDRRVVVTGLGMIAPVGFDIPSCWDNVVAGKSGIQPITHLDIEPFSVRFGGPIYGFDVEQYIPKKEARKMDKFIHYGVAAADQAIKDAGIEVTDQNAGRIGVVVGSGIGGITGIENGYGAYLKSLADHHAVMRAAMKTKQTVDPAAAEALEAAIKNLAEHYHTHSN